MEKKRTRKSGKRYAWIDSLRGLALLSMILYHGVWNIVYIYGMDWQWYRGKEAFYWQQSICWTFILLSGFCWSMGKEQLKNGLRVFGSGALVTAVTLLVMPQNRVVFGVLTCIGSCSLLTLLFKAELRRLPPAMGMGVSFLLFCLTYGVNGGKLGIGEFFPAELPDSWYGQTGLGGMLLTWLGFPSEGFYSTDYFSLFPWLFLFLTGFFMYRLCQKRGWLAAGFWNLRIPGVEVLGRNSLLIYLLHQPVLLLVGSIVFG